MVSRRLAAKAGVVAGVGAVVSAFGIVTPAEAYTCDVTIDPTEAALRNAIDDGNTTICITDGTLHMGDSGTNADNVPIVIDSDLTLVGLGDVTIDGDQQTAGFIVGASSTDANIDLVIDNLTVTQFFDWGYDELSDIDSEKTVPVIGFNRNVGGSITILNSHFYNNNSYTSIVGAIDQDNPFDLSSVYAGITIDNSVFENNSGQFGTVWGYSDLTITNSTFLTNDSYNGSSTIEGWSSDQTWDDSSAIIAGNYFEGNTTGESPVYLDSPDINVYNNTFAWNYTSSNTYGSAVTVGSGDSAKIAFNTFHENSSDYDNGSIVFDSGSDAVLLGNVFSTLESNDTMSIIDATVQDLGGNVSTANDSTVLDNESSLNSVTEEELLLNEPADNGGATKTMSLGAGSVAMDIMGATDAADELDLDLANDQRGEHRGSTLDAGAWDDGTGYLASTGVDARGIAITGGLIGAAGVALVTARRRKA
jgi:hypothetical protein